ncbi:hypothetical protein GE061_013364 [Apolygus lucorum]|uniref:Uncharacterized protein n=1 Tax=Apolygus lucorum TaxID=248454 RepID=A0A6A4JPF5_APOLU|nr:hypothetical protein GE061_013364 [Apolygus lucorum]
MIQSHPPRANLIREALTKFFADIVQAAASTPTTPANLQQHWLDFPQLENPSGQYLAFAQSFAHAFPWESILNLTDEQAVSLGAMRAAANPIAPIIAFGQVALVDDIAASWTNLSLRDKLILLGIMANQSRAEIQAILVSAVAGSVIAICKSGNASEDWFTKRVDLIKQNNPTLDVDQHLTLDAVRVYQQKYLPSIPDGDYMYRLLAFTYSALGETTLKTILWLIEQASAANASHALFTCEAIYNTDKRLCMYLVDPQLRPQLQKWASLIAALVNNPWCSIKEPPIQSSAYPDICNLGFVVMDTLIPRSLNNYAGKRVNGGLYSPLRIAAIAENVVEATKIGVEKSTNLMNVIQLSSSLRIPPKLQVISSSRENPRQQD